MDKKLKIVIVIVLLLALAYAIFYGSNDGVLNGKAYNDSKTLMSNLTEIIIPGGNHEQFAYYGSQTGDGIANIAPENQQNKTANEILKFTDDLF